jgi:excisionase family DNA binding protein
MLVGALHPTTIYRLLRHNQIPAFHVGSDCRFNIEAIDRWRKQQKPDARQTAEIKVSQVMSRQLSVCASNGTFLRLKES